MFELIRANKRRSVALIAGFVVVLTLVGAAFGMLIGNGTVGTIVALVFSGLMAFTSYWKADTIALAVSRAKPADPEQYKRLHNLVEGLCIASGLPKPGSSWSTIRPPTPSPQAATPSTPPSRSPQGCWRR